MTSMPLIESIREMSRKGVSNAEIQRRTGEVITRAELMEELWQTDSFVDDNTLTVNVNRLRRSLEKIGVPGDFVETKRGQGYLVRP